MLKAFVLAFSKAWAMLGYIRDANGLTRPRQAVGPSNNVTNHEDGIARYGVVKRESVCACVFFLATLVFVSHSFEKKMAASCAVFLSILGKYRSLRRFRRRVGYSFDYACFDNPFRVEGKGLFAGGQLKLEDERLLLRYSLLRRIYLM